VTSSGAHLQASGLVVRRGGRLVLDGAALDVPPGQVTALTAPSGAGKSTLLRCCTRLLEVEAGTVTLGGRDVRELPATELRRRVGLVPQQPAMLPGTVADNVRHGVPDADVRGALDAAGLDAAFADRDAGRLSGGEQARVAIARALSREPAVLLLDEPTAALDEAAADRLAATLRRLAGLGIGICAATHDRRWAERVADRETTLAPP
jgi:ABC-type multidrug transport system fused ATPase/permease subunit